MHEAQDQGATWLFCLQNILDRLKGRSFPGSCSGVSWRIALYISSTDYTRPLGYLSEMHSGITNSNAPRWHHFWNMRTTTHIPIVHARKRILSHRDCSTRCSQFPIFNCNPLPIEYLPLQQSLRFFTVSSSPSPCLPPHHAQPPSHKVCIRVARGGTIKAAVMTVG